jgi:hypothetical protein
MLSHYRKIAWVAAALILTACSQAPKAPTTNTTTAQAQPKPTITTPVPVSGQTAFWEMYKAAFAWAKDVEPLTLSNKDLAGFKNEGGNSPLWSATFASPSQGQARTFTYSIIETAELSKGVNVGGPIRWSGPTREVMPFQTSDFTADSTAAFAAASADAQAWLAKNPGKEPTFTLGSNARFASPVWYVMWGNKKSGFGAFVSATSGKVIHPN